jgi:hypothetical protein
MWSPLKRLQNLRVRRFLFSELPNHTAFYLSYSHLRSSAGKFNVSTSLPSCLPKPLQLSSSFLKVVLSAAAHQITAMSFKSSPRIPHGKLAIPGDIHISYPHLTECPSLAFIHITEVLGLHTVLDKRSRHPPIMTVHRYLVEGLPSFGSSPNGPPNLGQSPHH